MLSPISIQGESRAPAGLPKARPETARPLLLILLLGAALCLRAADSELAPLATKSLLLDVARAGHRLVAVGDRGHVLLSDDEGLTWRQIVVPTRAMLTGVAFGDANQGWAVGHDGVILATTDAGQSWRLKDHPAEQDTVYLDTFSRVGSHNFTVGAYGKCLRTADGGQTWVPTSPSADEVHFNQIFAGPEGTLYLAGESGTVLASGDQGTTWRKLDVPYEGSLFGLLPLDARTLLAYGLRGNVFISEDAGDTWTPRVTSVPVLIMAGVRLQAGPIVLAGLGGNFFISRDAARTFQAWNPAEFTGSVSSLIETADGALLAVGESGVTRLQLPEAAP